MRIPLNKSSMGEEEKNAAKAVIDSDALTMGAQCRAFEREFADYLGVEHAVMVNSGSSANLIALFAMADALIPVRWRAAGPYPAGIGGHRSSLDLVDHDLAGVAGRRKAGFRRLRSALAADGAGRDRSRHHARYLCHRGGSRAGRRRRRGGGGGDRAPQEALAVRGHLRGVGRRLERQAGRQLRPPRQLQLLLLPPHHHHRRRNGGDERCAARRPVAGDARPWMGSRHACGQGNRCRLSAHRSSLSVPDHRLQRPADRDQRGDRARAIEKAAGIQREPARDCPPSRRGSRGPGPGRRARAHPARPARHARAVRLHACFAARAKCATDCATTWRRRASRPGRSSAETSLASPRSLITPIASAAS